MNQVTITVTFGLSNSLTRSYPAGTTIRQVVEDPAVRQALGAPANAVARINRVEQPLDQRIQDGDEIVLETRGTSKAV